jgi:cell division protein FtsB
MRQSHTLKWGTVLQIFVLITLMAMLVVSYLVFKNHVFRLAQDESKLVKELRAIEERNRQLSGNLARLKSPLEIKRRVAALNLHLVSTTELETHAMDEETSQTTRLADWNGTSSGGQ